MAVQKDTKNWEVDVNTTFTFTVDYVDSNNNPVDLTDYIAKMQVRNAQGDKLAFSLTSPSGGITIDGPAGQVTVKMTPTQTSKLFFPKSVYDLMLTNTVSLDKTKLVGGYITAQRSVTV